MLVSQWKCFLGLGLNVPPQIHLFQCSQVLSKPLYAEPGMQTNYEDQHHDHNPVCHLGHVYTAQPLSYPPPPPPPPPPPTDLQRGGRTRGSENLRWPVKQNVTSDQVGVVRQQLLFDAVTYGWAQGSLEHNCQCGELSQASSYILL